MDIGIKSHIASYAWGAKTGETAKTMVAAAAAKK